MPNLISVLSERKENRQALVDFLNRYWLPAVVTRYNSEFGPRYFGRPRGEAIPTEPKLLTTFRTRLGTYIEYGLGVTWDGMLQREFGRKLRLSFAVAHEFPDFYLRDERGDPLMRIDSKFLHDESAEYSARFERTIEQTREFDDFLWYGAWKWQVQSSDGFVFPEVLETMIVPAEAIALERDISLSLRGGRFERGVPVVPPAWNKDTNFGKIDRIVHPSRRSAPDLDMNVRALLDFTRRHGEGVKHSVHSESPDGEPAAGGEASV